MFLHALPFGGQMWGEEVACFGRDAVAPTLYDEGDSLTQWAQAAPRLIGDEPCIAIGCSVCGSCALELARLAPEQVAGLVLIGAKAAVGPSRRSDSPRRSVLRRWCTASAHCTTAPTSPPLWIIDHSATC